MGQERVPPGPAADHGRLRGIRREPGAAPEGGTPEDRPRIRDRYPRPSPAARNRQVEPDPASPVPVSRPEREGHPAAKPDHDRQPDRQHHDPPRGPDLLRRGRERRPRGGEGLRSGEDRPRSSAPFLPRGAEPRPSARTFQRFPDVPTDPGYRTGPRTGHAENRSTEAMGSGPAALMHQAWCMYERAPGPASPRAGCAGRPTGG